MLQQKEHKRFRFPKEVSSPPFFPSDRVIFMSAPTTTGDRVYLAMRDQILFGELKPGTRLVQRQLASEFGTSNIPIVESIRRLERDGLLVTHPKWGAQVNTWTGDDIEAIYLMRENLEAVTCRLFAQRASAAEKLDLREYSRRYDESARQHDIKITTEADIALHLYIVQCTKSSNLYQLAEKSCVITAALRNIVWDTNSHESNVHLTGLVGVHDEMVAALRSGDSVRAENAGRAHVHDALERILPIINQNP